jgi:hypothetical protein
MTLWNRPALNSSTGTAAAPAYVSPNAGGRSPPSSRSSVSTLREPSGKAGCQWQAEGMDLRAAGVDFIDENGGGPNVRLRKRQAKKS